MGAGRRRSLLEDEELVEVDEPLAPSGGDVCERCGCTREKHEDDGCRCGRCDEFEG